MVRLVIFIFIFIYPIHSYGVELTTQERTIFSFIDLNKDNTISSEEANKLIELIFQLIDKNQDGNISELEIIDLKDIIESLT